MTNNLQDGYKDWLRSSETMPPKIRPTWNVTAVKLPKHPNCDAFTTTASMQERGKSLTTQVVGRKFIIEAPNISRSRKGAVANKTIACRGAKLAKSSEADNPPSWMTFRTYTCCSALDTTEPAAKIRPGKVNTTWRSWIVLHIIFSWILCVCHHYTHYI